MDLGEIAYKQSIHEKNFENDKLSKMNVKVNRQKWTKIVFYAFLAKIFGKAEKRLCATVDTGKGSFDAGLCLGACQT